MRLVREGLELRRTAPNFRMSPTASGSRAGCPLPMACPAMKLPNLYHSKAPHPRALDIPAALYASEPSVPPAR